MLSANILRRLRPCIVSQSFSNFDRTVVRHGTKVTASFFTIAKSVKQPHAVRRSLLNTNTKLQWFCPSTRCLTAETHSTDQSLIYTGSLGTAVRGVKLFSYSTSGASLFLMPTILMTSGVQSLVMQAAFCGIIGFFTFLTPVLLHFVTKGYVVRLYHQPHTDSYTAITYSVFLTEKKTVFTQGQVRIPAVSKMFTTFYANKLGLLVNPDLFPIPQDYNHLMGYDKPFSFDTDDMNTPDKS